MTSKKKNTIFIPSTDKGQQRMTRIRGIWSADYYINDKIRRKSLGTKDQAEAQVRQAEFYRELRSRGAVTLGPITPASKIKQKDSMYIHYRKPYVVKVQRTVVGYCDSFEEAQRMRDRYMKGVNDE